MKYIGNVQSQANAEVFAVASGALPDGKPVIVNSNGTVSVAAEVNVAAAQGSSVTFESGASGNASFAYDTTSDRVLIAYVDGNNNNYGTVIVGVVDASDNSISFGTAVVFDSGNVDNPAISFDPKENKLLVAYRDNGDGGRGNIRHGTLNAANNTTSWSDEYEFNDDTDIGSISVVYDSSDESTMIQYIRANDNKSLNSRAAKHASGGGFTFSNNRTVVNNTQVLNGQSIIFDSDTQKCIFAYTDLGNSKKGACRVLFFDGTTLECGDEQVFQTSNAIVYAITYDTTANKIVVFYENDNDSSKGYAVVGTVNGSNNSISYGTPVKFQDSQVSNMDAAYDSTANKHFISYRNNGDSSYGTYVTGTVSGTSISFDSSARFATETGNYTNVGFDPDNSKIVLTYQASASKAIVFQNAYTSTNLTTENFLGFTGGEVTFVNQAVGSEVVFEQASAEYISTTFDSNSNKIVISYVDEGNSNYGTAIVGTISGTSVSFGSPVVFEQAGTFRTSATFDSNLNKVVIAYRDTGNSSYGTAIVGTVSGTSISFGTAVVFESATTDYISATFDSSSNKVVIAFSDGGNSDYGKAIVGTVSGTNISFGSATTFESAYATNISATFDTSNNKVVIAYNDVANSNYGTAIIGTVSGTSISFGSPVVFNAGETYYISTTFDTSNNKVVIAFSNGSNSFYGTVVVGTVSGTSISFGDLVVFNAGNAFFISSTFDTTAGKVCISYQDDGNSDKGTFVVGTVSGTSISIGSETVFNDASTATPAATFDSNSSKVFLAFHDNGNNSYGTGIVVQLESTSRPEVADGKTATIQVGGSINTQQNALTAGQQYFVQEDGTLGLTADSTSVIAGTAVSATDLIVKG